MSDKKVILDCDCLYPYQSGVCIICAPTGIVCTVQAGGLACSHPEAEGFPMPIPQDEDLNKAIEEFNDCSWGCFLDVDTFDENFDKDEHRIKYAKAIDEFLSSHINGKFYLTIMSFEFDYSRLTELMEGWWPVLVSFKNTEFNRNREEIFYKNKFKGYLYFGNCD